MEKPTTILVGDIFDLNGGLRQFVGFDFFCGELTVKLKRIGYGEIGYHYPLLSTLPEFKFIDRRVTE